MNLQRVTFLLLISTALCCKRSIKTNHEKAAASTVEQATLEQPRKKDHQIREIKKAVVDPDNEMNDLAWSKATWYPIDQLWLGKQPTHEDYSGRYKMMWASKALYILVEIRDDKLVDQYDDPFKLWWDDDCVEIFVDADNSGGKHQFNNNAFAYHVALDGNVVDLDSKKNPQLYNSHVITKRVIKEDVSIWEFEVAIYDDTYKEGKESNPMTLVKDQKIGFAIAYNDNDGSKERENFIGSVFVPGEDKNQGWINADIFGTIVLKE